jgi:hypothetical protein
MEYLSEILAIVGIGGASGVFVLLKRASFYFKALKQARDTFESWKAANKTIYDKIQTDPEKKELAKVLSGGAAKIEALTGLDL